MSLARRLRTVFTDGRAAYYYFQKGLRNAVLRRWLASFVARFLPPAPVATAEKPDAGKLLSALSEDGFCYVDSIASREQRDEIRSYFATKKCRDVERPEAGEFLAPDGVPKGLRKLAFSAKDIVACPHLLDIANDRLILDVVGRALGCKPTISGLTCWWSIAGGASEPVSSSYQDEMFHRDVEDLRFFKLFLYLTDVSGESGPHVFVKGTQNCRNFVSRRPFTEREIIAEFGPGRVQVFTGSEGTCFLENTWGIHRATPLKAGNRLIFQVTYSLTKFNPQAPRAAVASLPMRPALDRYINRVYLSPA